ncbi:MAG: iron-sulfur cluster assembly accessory protein [Elusimicrobia bacterium]|nr:iron-sulfur cluster assembly accessory protein [Elusimicrobiota bacterium]
MLTLTPKAVKKVSEFFTDPEAKGKSLRVGVKPGGCSGYEYSFSFDDKKDGDTEMTFDGFTVLVDPNSAPFLKASEIDYAEDGTAQGFKIRNPNVKSSCGCGQSNKF